MGCKMEPYWVGGLCVSLQQRGRAIIVTNDVSSADCKHRTTLRLSKSQAQGPLNNILKRSGNVRQPCWREKGKAAELLQWFENKTERNVRKMVKGGIRKDIL